MNDERGFLKRLQDEFADCPMWHDVQSTVTWEKRSDLEPNQIMVFIRPENAELPVVHAFRISVESLLFPPDARPVNGQHPRPSSES